MDEEIKEYEPVDDVEPETEEDTGAAEEAAEEPVEVQAREDVEFDRLNSEIEILKGRIDDLLTTVRTIIDGGATVHESTPDPVDDFEEEIEPYKRLEDLDFTI